MTLLTTGPINPIREWCLTVLNLSGCEAQVTIKVVVLCPPGSEIIGCKTVVIQPKGSSDIKLKVPCCNNTQVVLIEHCLRYCDLVFSLEGTACKCKHSEKECFAFSDLVHLECGCPKHDGCADADYTGSLYYRDVPINDVEMSMDDDMDC